MDHRLDIIDKSIDDLSWYNRISDIAYIDKVYITGPPEANITDTLALGAYNPVRFIHIFLYHVILIQKRNIHYWCYLMEGYMHSLTYIIFIFFEK
ncbi:MAG TPA: hypothetical protein PK908_00770 [Bacteroidales bacterium]|nr:hypothetical protein [Bacteroidales bacterium]